MRQQQPLPLRLHREEASDHRARAVRSAAGTGPRVALEGVEPVVDGDLVACCDGTPGEDIHTVSHRIRVARVVQVAPGRGHHREAVEPELTEVDPFPGVEGGQLLGREHAHVATAEDERTFGKGAPGIHTPPLCTGISNVHVPDHRTSATASRP